jgi:hypothetical protein
VLEQLQKEEKVQMSTFEDNAKRQIKELSEQAHKHGLTKDKWLELTRDEVNAAFSKPLPSAIPLMGALGKSPDKKNKNKSSLGSIGEPSENTLPDEDDTK